MLASCFTLCYRKQSSPAKHDLPFCYRRGCHPFDRYQKATTQGSDGDGASQASTSSEIETKQRIVRGYVDFSAGIWNTLPSGAFWGYSVAICYLRYGGNIDDVIALSLVKGLLRYNYETRSTIAMALQSSWITGDLDDLEKAYRERISLV